jgi:hypothetical protein
MGLRDWANKAKDLAGKHPDQADKMADRAEGEAQQRTGHRYDEQIGKGVDDIQSRYGGGKDEDGGAER